MLDESQRNTVADALLARDGDVQAAERVIELLQTQLGGGALRWVIDNRLRASFEVRMQALPAGSMFGDADAAALLQLGAHIRAVLVVKRDVRVVVQRDGATTAPLRSEHVVCAPGDAKHAGIAIDFERGRVTNATDRANIERIVDEVLNIDELIPVPTFYYEPIDSVGYRLVFGNLPETVDTAFFAHLRRTLGESTVLRVYALIEDDGAKLVVNLRGYTTPSSAAAPVVLKKRVRSLDRPTRAIRRRR